MRLGGRLDGARCRAAIHHGSLRVYCAERATRQGSVTIGSRKRRKGSVRWYAHVSCPVLCAWLGILAARGKHGGSAI